MTTVPTTGSPGPSHVPHGHVLVTVVITFLTLALCTVVLLRVPDLAARLTVVVSLVNAAMGTLIALRQPRNLEGRLLQVGALAGALAFATPSAGGWALPILLVTTQLLLRFPDGHLPSARWRPVSWAAWALIVAVPILITLGSPVTLDGRQNPIHVPAAEPLLDLLALVPVAMLLCVASVVQRYRCSGQGTREQIRWIAFAGTLLVFLYLLTALAGLAYSSAVSPARAPDAWFSPANPPWLTAMQSLAVLSFTLIPLAFAVAITRYRLYDIDRIISRTTSYTLVTGILVATYALLVTSLTRLLPDSDSALAVAASTLAAAALARPMLRRIQAVVDRRFHRARYDAERTVDGFGARLRDEIDTAAVSSELAAAVQQSLQPGLVAVWLKGQP